MSKSIGKRAEVNWYLIGAIVMAFLLIILIIIIRGQSGHWSDLLKAIFGMRP